MSLKDVTKWVFWLQYVSIFRYGFNVCSKNNPVAMDRTSRVGWYAVYCLCRPSCGMNWKVLHTVMMVATPSLSMEHAM